MAQVKQMLFALRLLLDNDLPISASRLLESDFNRALIDWRGHWIVISLTFNELDNSEGASLLAQHLEDVAQENSVGSYHYYFRPKKSIRKNYLNYQMRMEKIKIS